MSKLPYPSKILANSIRMSFFYGSLITIAVVIYLYISYTTELDNKIKNDVKTIKSYLTDSLDEPLKHENVIEIRKIIGPFLKTSLDFIVIYNNSKIPIFTSGNPPDKSIVDAMITNSYNNPFSIKADVKSNNEFVGFFVGSLRVNEILFEKKQLFYKVIQVFLALLIFNTLIIYFTLNTIVRRIISLSDFIHKYPSSIDKYNYNNENKIDDEISVIYRVFQNVYDNNLLLSKSLSEKTLFEAMGAQARQVAHDIRSPLSVLNIVTSSLQGLEKEQKELIKSSIQRINDIANDLLKKGKNPILESSFDSYAREAETLLINPLVDSIITEKRLQFKNKPGINITIFMNQIYGSFIHINSSDLKRILSNLINNSVEAIGDKSGNIEVSLDYCNQQTILKIIDNGPGIPPHILDRLGHENISHGKENTESGSGLGVLHAKKTIESMDGHFSISSTLGKGTEVTISLPLSEKPSWFLETLSIKEKTTILVCDDDSSIIALWKKRFSDFPLVKINYFTSIDTLKEFLLVNKELDFALLIDYEFSGEQKNGLDFIIENQLSSKSILVTSHYDEEIVIRTCTDHGIKQIPKNICALVPIEVTSAKSAYDAVVLDNEDLQVRSWQFAAIQKGKTILVFSKHEEFIAALPDIDNKTPIFIDSILGDNIKGEDIAKQVFDQGFKNVYMSSGHDPSYFKDMTFLKGVIGKTPFFP